MVMCPNLIKTNSTLKVQQAMCYVLLPSSSAEFLFEWDSSITRFRSD